MNINRLNTKFRSILDAHDLVQRDTIQTLQKCKIGVNAEYLWHSFDWDQNIFQQLQRFKEILNNIVIVINQTNEHTLDANLVQQTIKENNRAQFKELLYNDSFIEYLLPKRVFIRYLQQLDIEYIVAPNACAQLRYLLISGHISAILSQISFLKYCYQFKELQSLILSVDQDSFEWVEVRLVTSKSQLTLDSLSELFSLWDFANGQQCFNDEIVNKLAIDKHEKPYNDLTIKEQTGLLYLLSYQFFFGKMTIEQRLKNKNDFKDSKSIINYLKSVKELPHLDLNGEMQSVIQLPTEVNIFNSFGIGIKRKRATVHSSIELGELTQECNYLQLINYGPWQTSTKFIYKESTYNPTLCRSLGFYYKKLKLASRKNSLSDEVQVWSAQLNVNLRFLHVCKFILIDNEKGTQYASALFYADNTYFDQLFTYLYIMESPISHLLTQQFYDYYIENDQLHLQKLNFNKRDKYVRNPYQKHQQLSTSVIILWRAFSFMCVTKQQDQFSEVLNSVTNYFAELYDQLTMQLFFEINTRQIESFVGAARHNPFNKFYSADPQILLFLTKQTKTLEGLDLMVKFWKEIMNVHEYLARKGLNTQSYVQANEYLNSLI